MGIIILIIISIHQYLDKSVEKNYIEDTNIISVYIFILLPLLLRLIPYGGDHEDRTIPNTTSIDICTDKKEMY